MKWTRLVCGEHIDLEETLFSGQVFHFRSIGGSVYKGVLGDMLVVLRQSGSSIYYADSHPGIAHALERFFNLGVCTRLETKKHGLRFLTGDLYPTIFSFICSSNNNIKRITQMVEYLYSKGRPVEDPMDENSMDEGPVHENTHSSCATITKEDPKTGATDTRRFYCFPALDALAEIEEELRINKFGYRAGYITGAARFLLENKADLASMSYPEARRFLMQIKGIGRKVADCICLMALRHFNAVPIDTHVLKYSTHAFNLDIKILNDRSYGLIQQEWIRRYGEHAGIAQLYAFKEYVDARSSAKPRIL